MDESYCSFNVRIPKRWLRFSLLSLLILVTGICLVLGSWPQQGDRKLHTIQLQLIQAEAAAQTIEKLFFLDAHGDVLEELFPNWLNASKSKTVTGDDGSKLSVEVDAGTNSIRVLATDAELKKIEDLLQKLGEGPNPPAPQPPPKSKFRLLSQQQALDAPMNEKASEKARAPLL